MTPTIRLLVPTAESAAPAVSPAPRPAAITRIAVLHNGQPHFDRVASAVMGLLADRPGLEVTAFRKPRYSSPIAPEMLEEIVGGHEAAIVGLAC